MKALSIAEFLSIVWVVFLCGFSFASAVAACFSRSRCLAYMTVGGLFLTVISSYVLLPSMVSIKREYPIKIMVAEAQH